MQLSKSLVQVQFPNRALRVCLSSGKEIRAIICRAASGYLLASSGTVFIIFRAFLFRVELLNCG